MHGEQAALHLHKIIQNLYENRRTGAPFVFYLLGPPGIGKTFFQKHLFSHWLAYTPCFIRASSALIERRLRYAHHMGECSSEAYDVGALRQILKCILKGQSAFVKRYDHQTGMISPCEYELLPSKFIYLEGPVWVHLLDTFSPDFTVLLCPKDDSSWERAYTFRNNTFRNYDPAITKKMFELANESWRQCLLESSGKFVVNQLIEVNFKGSTFLPDYVMIDHL